MKSLKILSFLYIAAIVSLFLYSFTQVDLGLTLTRVSFLHQIQNYFQHIGYFNRPLSTALYILVIFLLFGLYLILVNLSYKNVISRKYVWTLIILSSCILTFSYNAFSYDLFNYIFDAKIVTFYHQNPYEHKALDYSNDPMLSFMHWTHRTYPYGPTWLVLTIPLSYLGFQFFIPTLILFKGLTTLSFLGSAYFIEKIVKTINNKHALFALVFFALNPFNLVESVVSAHNDIVMIGLVLIALFSIIEKKYVRSFILFVLSVGVKFATVFVLPVVFFYLFWNKNRKINWDKVFFYLTVSMVIPVVYATIRTNFQPWYLLYVTPFASLLAYRYYVVIPVLTLSLFSLYYYVPYLQVGNWNGPIPTLLSEALFLTLIFSLVMIVLFSFKRKEIIR